MKIKYLNILKHFGSNVLTELIQALMLEKLKQMCDLFHNISVQNIQKVK